ncbi:hypothetical protein [Collinsella sp. An7]|uniref:hypothetical protein n=1 Tax=Collinsella sp. An7 TaxID=1965651 RepID=UPI001EF3F69F|nr:hypothetical protein [Collinsella sp. An7]
MEHVVYERVLYGVAGPRHDAALPQVHRYRVDGLAVRPAAEHLADYLRLLRHDLIAPVIARPVPEAPHAVGLALKRVALHATARAYRGLAGLARGKALKKLLVDDALGGIGYGLKGGNQLHPVGLKLALVYGGIERIAAEPVHHVDEDDVGLAGVGDHLLELRAVIRAPGYGVVAVLRHYGVALAGAPVAAHPELALDRLLALLGAREPRVENGGLL